MKHLFFVLLACAACSFHQPSNSIAPGDDDGGTDADAGSDSDIGTPIDAPPDAPRVVVLFETGHTPHTGDSIFCHSNQMLRDNYWLRAFTLGDFPQITGPLHVTSVTFGSEDTRNATPTVTLFSYSGDVGTPTLDPSKMTLVDSHAQAVPDSASPQAIVFPITADIPAGGVFVMQIAAADTSNGGGQVTSLFHAAFSDDPQTRPNYYSSNTCGLGSPTAQGGASLIMDISGTY